MHVPDPANPKVMAVITITFRDNGHVHCDGPLEQQLLMYGLLDMAKDIVREHNKKLIAAPPPVGLPKDFKL